MDKVVKKFGGSSLADVAACALVGKIVRADQACKVVVVSAPGGPVKMTDSLIKVARLIREQDDREARHRWCNGFVGHFLYLREAFKLSSKDANLPDRPSFEDVVVNMRQGRLADGTPADEAWLVSRGEWMMAKIMASYLGGRFIDAADVIRLRADGSVDERATQRLIAAACAQPRLCVIPGFYGAREDGRIFTLGRGGSDVTLALVARALNARAEKWTDVDGVCEASPRIVPNAQPIARLSPKEMRELAVGGASVLHQDAVRYTREWEGSPPVPVWVRNTRNAEAPGTVILPDGEASLHPPGQVVGIAVRNNFVTISVYEMGMNDALGYAATVLDALRELGVSLDHIVTGADSMAITIHVDSLPKDLTVAELLIELRRAHHLATIEMEDAVAMVVVVGSRIRQATGVLAEITSTLFSEGVPLSMLSHGASDDAIVLGVPTESAAHVVQQLHAAFFSRH